MAKYQTPRGTQDLLPAQTRVWQQVEEVMRQVSYVYGYDEIRTPVFENTGVFKRENDSSDMVNKEMYTFSINGEDSLTLRPEGTAGIVRSFVENKGYGNMELPAKFYYLEEMFRYERPQKGRYRQFKQFGIENIGVKSPLIDAEVIALGISVVGALGLSQLKVLVNTLGDEESRTNYRLALQAYFKPYLAELCPDCQRRFEQNPLRLLDCKIDHNHPCMVNVPSMKDYLNTESKVYFEAVLKALDDLGMDYEIDDRLVRGLDYYTHTVFEVVSTHPDSGSQATVFAGGRYDGLVEYFGGPDMSGVGFAMGVERLMILAQAEGIELAIDEGVDVYVMSLGDVDTLPLQITTELRANGYRTEMDYTKRSMKAQFKSVERKMAKVIVICGEEEAKTQCVNIKNIASKEQITIPLTDIVQQIDHWLNEEHECSGHCHHE